LDGVRPNKDAVKEFAEGPKRLEATLEGLTTFELDWRGDEAGWTIREIIHHMVDTDVRQTTHTKIALANSGSTMEFGWHPGNVSMAKKLNYVGRSIEPALALFRANREHFVQMLNIIPAAWDHYLLVKASHDS
jgi:hypothetical protein